MVNRALQNELNIRLAYQRLFNSDDGKIVLDAMMKRFHVLTSSFANTPEQTVFQEGERNVILHIMNYLTVDPQVYARKYKEAQDHNLKMMEDEDG